MGRDKGLRRTTAITGALVAASLAGTLAVGIAARAAETTETGTTTESSTTADNSSATDNSTGNSDTTTTDSPSITSGSADEGQATSGGS